MKPGLRALFLYQDECSFVSLRDVDRVLSVMSWFYGQSQDTRTLFDEMDGQLFDEDANIEENDLDEDEDEEEEEEEEQGPRRRQVCQS